MVLLFVNEVDSQVFSIAYIFNSTWLHTVVDEAEEYSENLLDESVLEADDAMIETTGKSKHLSSAANSLRASAQDQERVSGSSKRRLGASSIRSRSEKSSLMSISQQQELMIKFESLQRQMSELQAELTGESPLGADDDGEENDQDGQEDETPQQQSSCTVQ